MQTVDNEEKRISEERQAFWTSVYPDWPFWTQSQRKKAKKMYKNKDAKCNSCVPANLFTAPCEMAVDAYPIDVQYTKVYNYAQMCYTTAVQKKEEETAMTENQMARERLTTRLRDVFRTKMQEARKTFFIDDDAMPTTGQAMIDRITSGMYVYDKDAETKITAEYGYSYGWSQFIKWRDPAKPEDQVGFKAFTKKLDEAYETAKDEIIVNDPVAGLATLNAFKTLTIA